MEILISWPLGENPKICENSALDVMRPPGLVKVTKLTDVLFRDRDSPQHLPEQKRCFRRLALEAALPVRATYF